MTEQHAKPEVEITEEDQADQFDFASEENDDLLKASTNVTSLHEESLFCQSFVEIWLVHQN